MKWIKFTVINLLVLFLMGSMVWADSDSAIDLTREVQDLQKELQELKAVIRNQDEKIQQLEIKAPKPGEPGAPLSDEEFNDKLSIALGGASRWLKDLKFSGDLRLRYEAFDFTSGNRLETDPRNRFRYRLRFGFEKTFSPEIKVGFGLASGEAIGGSTLGDITSTNTSFDSLFALKNIFVEKAFATYTPHWAKIGPVEKLEVTAGKAANPFEIGSGEIIWDRDLRPEGIYEKINFKLIDTDNFDLKAYLIGGQYVMDEDATIQSGIGTNGDAELYGVQGGLNPSFKVPFLEKPVELLTAVSYYNFIDYANNNNFIVGTTSFARGNPNVGGPTSQLDARDFQIVESYSELTLYPYGVPTRVFMDIADNVGNSPIGSQGGTVLHSNLAWAIGTKLGKIAKKGDWEAGYDYRYIGANSTVGAFNDSDFGLGHSGKQGHVFKLNYALTDYLILSGAMYFVDNLSPGTAGIVDEQQRRFQVDLAWKF